MQTARVPLPSLLLCSFASLSLLLAGLGIHPIGHRLQLSGIGHCCQLEKSQYLEYLKLPKYTLMIT
jgi:hypothetical protein